MNLSGKFHQLNELADPCKFTDPLVVSDYSKDILLNLLKGMLAIRIIETKIAELVSKKIANTPCHLCIGQEAIPVGVSHSLDRHDYIFGTHRSHGHYLAAGGSPFSLITEILGKKEGSCKGMGGSMHLYDSSIGFMGSVPIVGATIPIAVGAAMAAKMDNGKSISVCYFGDGATEEGVLHESLNLASIFDLPVLFICENNLYSSHLDIAMRQPADRTSRFAEAHCIESITIDGNNVLEVLEKSRYLIEKMRLDRRPRFIEMVTYRWLGHVGSDENIDVGIRRSKNELLAWKGRDPIKRLYEGMLREKHISHNFYQNLQFEKEKEIDSIILEAQASDYPTVELMLNSVYKQLVV